MSAESQQMLQFQSEVYRRLDELDRRHESSLNRLYEKLERKLDVSLKMQKQMSNSQRKFFDENELRLREDRDNMGSRMERLNEGQENFQQQLSAHEVQMQKDLLSLNHNEKFSCQVSRERQKLISHQLFQLVEVLNVLNSNVMFVTNKCDPFHKRIAEQIQSDVSEPIQALEKKFCDLEKQVLELAKGSSFQNPAVKPTSEGQHFTSASVEQGNLFLGDVSVQGQVIGQVDLRQFFEGNTTNKTEIQNINNITVNQLKEAAATRSKKPKDTRSLGTMTDEPTLETPTEVMSQETMADLPELKDTRSLGTMTDEPSLETPTEPKDTRSLGIMTDEPSLETPTESESTMSLITKKELQRSKRHTGRVAPPPEDKAMTKETIVVLGGYESERFIESYNPAGNNWTTEENFSDGPDKETMAVTLGEVIVIMEVENKRTRSLDFASKRWTELKSPPKYRIGMRATADGNLVYLTGGVDHLTRCDVYDLQSNQWSEGPNLNVGRYYHGSATLKGKIYCVGGSDRNWKYFTSTEVLDPRKEGEGRWTSVADMKVGRDGLGLASCSRFLWAVGGWDGSSRLKDLERYDPVSDSWTKMADMEVERYFLSVCFFSGKLYAIGGYGVIGQTLYTVESYDPEKDEWTQVVPLNQRRYLHASCVVQFPSGM